MIYMCHGGMSWRFSPWHIHWHDIYCMSWWYIMVVCHVVHVEKKYKYMSWWYLTWTWQYDIYSWYISLHMSMIYVNDISSLHSTMIYQYYIYSWHITMTYLHDIPPWHTTMIYHQFSEKNGNTWIRTRGLRNKTPLQQTCDFQTPGRPM